MKARIIQSPAYDDKLTPDTPRYYVNEFLWKMAFLFTAFYIVFSCLLLGKNLTAGLVISWSLFTKNNIAIEAIALSIFNTTNTLSLMISYCITMISSLSLSFLIVYFTTKPTIRREFKEGKKLNDGVDIVENYKKRFDDFSESGLSLFNKTDICVATEQLLDEYLPFSKVDQEKNLIVLGDAGSGKSVVINHFYRDIAMSDIDIGLVHTIKGTEVKDFMEYAQVYNIAVKSIDGEDVHAIDFLSFIKDENALLQDEKTYTLVDCFTNKSSKDDPFFSNSARQVSFACMREAIEITTKADEFLENTEKIFTAQIQTSHISSNLNFSNPAVQKANPQILNLINIMNKHNITSEALVSLENEKMTSAVIASCVDLMNKFKKLSKFWKGKRHINLINDFYLKKETRKFLVLNNDTTIDVCSSYISAIINLSSKYLVTANYENKLNRKIYFILDEFPMLNSVDINNFLNLSDVGRSKKIRLVVALQKLTQIKEKFNADPGNFYSSFHNKILGRVAECDYEIVQKTIGKSIVEDSIVSRTLNEHGKYSSTFKKERKEIDTFLAQKLTSTSGAKVDANGKFLGVQMFYFIQGYEEIFTFIKSPVDNTDLKEKYQLNIEKRRKQNNARRLKREKQKALDALINSNAETEIVEQVIEEKTIEVKEDIKEYDVQDDLNELLNLTNNKK